MLELAADYRELAEFISLHESCGEGGMYLEAVCQGLDQVLEPYRSALTSLEQAMLEEPESVPLSLLQHRLLPHRPPLKVNTRWGGV